MEARKKDPIEDLEKENASLSEQVKRLVQIEAKLYSAQQELDYQMNIYRNLYQLGNQLGEAKSTSDLFDAVTMFISEKLDIEKAMICKVEEGGLSLFSHYGYYDEEEERVKNINTFSNLIFEEIIQKDASHFNHLEDDKIFMDLGDFIGCHEFFIFSLKNETKEISHILFAGNSKEQGEYYSKIVEGNNVYMGLANLVSRCSEM